MGFGGKSSVCARRRQSLLAGDRFDVSALDHMPGEEEVLHRANQGKALIGLTWRKNDVAVLRHHLINKGDDVPGLSAQAEVSAAHKPGLIPNLFDAPAPRQRILSHEERALAQDANHKDH